METHTRITFQSRQCSNNVEEYRDFLKSICNESSTEKVKFSVKRLSSFEKKSVLLREATKLMPERRMTEVTLLAIVGISGGSEEERKARAEIFARTVNTY